MRQDDISRVIADELEKFQGVWKQVSCNIDGVKNAAEEYGSQPRVTFAGFEYVVTGADGAVVIKGRFELDPTQTPKTIDWTDTFGAGAGTTIPAIYFLDGDRFLFCAAGEGRIRPPEFSSGRGRIIRVHERVPPSA